MNYTQLSARPLLVTETLLSIASNHQPLYYLPQAIDILKNWGDIQLSQVIIDNGYHNYMAYIQLYSALTYDTLLQQTKQLEQQHDRAKFTKPVVSLDIDIIAISIDKMQMPINNYSQFIDEKGSPLQYLTKHWFAINRRLPLANYEKQGLQDLAIRDIFLN